MFLFGKKKNAGPPVRVHLKVAGFVGGKMNSAEFDLEAPAGATVKQCLKLADKSPALKGKPVAAMLAMPKAPTVMVNGEGIVVPDDLGRVIEDGDELSIMTPFAGG